MVDGSKVSSNYQMSQQEESKEACGETFVHWALCLLKWEEVEGWHFISIMPDSGSQTKLGSKEDCSFSSPGLAKSLAIETSSQDLLLSSSILRVQ